MDSSSLSVIYVNRRFGHDRLASATSTAEDATGAVPPQGWEADDLRQDVELLLQSFSEVQLCSSGTSCLTSLFDIQEGAVVDLKPAMVLLDTTDDERIPGEVPTRSRSPSPMSRPESQHAEIHTPDEEVYGLKLLQRIMTEAHLRNLSKMIVPILLIGQSSLDTDPTVDGSNDLTAVRPVDRRLVLRCLDLGAADVIIRPMHSKCIMSLEIHAHRARRDADRERQAILEIRKGRKRSWVGVSDEKPFAYLREAMVSGLMKGICRLQHGGDEERISNVSLGVSSDRQAAIAAAIGHWHFSAHDFSDDELLVAAMLMFKHTLSMPELERWRISPDQLINFLVACRAAYNSFVPYHNFRHVVDVLQATFNFLVHIGTIAPYPSDSVASAPTKSPIAQLLHPFDGLTLLVTAIGHDVGHPGVNNGFLITLNAPLAQLYNDRSVLESFHCAAYSQILRTYWPAAFEDTKMRKLMISSILATDMGLHFDYMKKMGDLQEKLETSNTTDGWNGRMIEEQKALACSLLIKCADISNVARKHDAALKWMYILSDEFSRQSSMETELDIVSSLMAPPKKDYISLAKAQLSFMNMFAIPLFQGVADIMPSMKYTVDELETNKDLFERQVSAEQAKEDPVRRRLLKDGTFSPRTMSFAVGPGAQQPAESTGPSSQLPGLEPSAASDSPSTLTPGEGLKMDSPEADNIPTTVIDPVDGAVPVADTNQDYKEVNGFVPSFPTVATFAASDPFNSNTQCSDARDCQGNVGANKQQRCSETTEGSAAGQCGGDWASQATSATTGKTPISPSTQGTSIVSRESGERQAPAPTTNLCEPENLQAQPQLKVPAQSTDGQLQPHESNGSNGSLGKLEGGKVVKKKSSRFRMNNFPFFRRHKGANSPASSNDSMNQTT